MLKINVLGRPAVRLDGVPISGFISDKALALLCYLAIEQSEHARERLADVFWGHFPAERARANLRQALHNLKKLVPGYLVVNRKVFLFNADRAHRIDAAEFEHRLEPPDRGTPPRPHQDSEISATRIAELEATTRLYQGDFLADLFLDGAPEFESWLGLERERLHALGSFEMLGGLHRKQRNWSAAAQALRQLLAIEPWRDAAHRDLMLTLAHQQQFDAALAQFESCRQVLVGELGVEPRPETVALLERIRAARTIHRRPLPPQPTPFLGRSLALSDIGQLLLRDDGRLVSIIGLGDVGKTRLALAVAEALQSGFLEGVAFVPLSAVFDEDGIYMAIAEALEIPLLNPSTPAEQLANYLEDKEILLVLDNFEHLLDFAELLDPLLNAAVSVRWLVTSRARLGLRGESSFSLGGMVEPTGEPNQLSSGGQLFEYTAKLARPDFEADEADRLAIARICELVEGLPLAIELAASWVRLLPCSQIAEELSRDLAFLEKNPRTTSAAKRSLAAAFDYSWERLPAEAQQVFMGLSVFQGAFSRQLAQTATGANLETLTILSDRSLLSASHSGHFQIHGLLKQYAAEKLAARPSELDHSRERHGRAYLEWLGSCEAALKQGGLETTVAALQTEWENVRLAWLWAIEQREFLPLDSALSALYECLSQRQRYREGQQLISLAITASGGDEQTVLRARLQLALGAFNNYLGMTAESLALFDESRAVLARHKVGHDLALNQMWTGFTIGNTGYSGRLSDGAELLRESLASFEQLDDVYYQARCLGNLGNMFYSQGDHAQALLAWQRSLAIFENLGIIWGQAGTLVSMARAGARPTDRSQANWHGCFGDPGAACSGAG